MNTSKEQHTPTPWILGGSAAWSEAAKDRGPVFICDIREGTHVPVGTNQANARLIVDAVNHHHRYKAALEAITRIAGNLTDEAVEAVGGVNDARSRALMVLTARQIAQNALAEKES